ncbi:SDR family NAD(P)-dependent oxidoreductase [Hyphomicrobium sp.]|uniref:SDR family NAD(P)-dependent oxidoreductase n=1 Tax=Hyphomicrobium sp. TaxID=82 RepID=UPI000F96B555|nr:SDR family NAD(P)-dependent oxidoreductase [Hyphomicrobium sp.]RUO98447.1 MAG: SDR family NAD(P)-dependent oxidoreductase [Hyphomicrobium sp.]
MTRTILITGCSSGIGLDAARTLQERGWRVIATARKPEDLARLNNFLNVEALPLELSDPQSIATCAIRALEMTRGKIDALFNNAAFGQPGAVEDLTPKLLREQFEVNVVGTHDLTRRLIPAMRKNGSGRIVNCSSVLGMIVAPYRGAYCASKFALEALTTSLRLELEGSGIQVSLIEPGPIRSRFVEHSVNRLLATVDIENSPHRSVYRSRLEAMRAGGQQTFKLEPEAVTKKLIHALESRRPRRHYYVTTPTYLAAAMRRVLPAFAIDYFARRF